MGGVAGMVRSHLESSLHKQVILPDILDMQEKQYITLVILACAEGSELL